MNDGEMSLTEHLAELRSRLIKMIIGLVLGMVISFTFVNRIMELLIELAEPHQVQAISIMEKFAAYMKVAFIFGVAFAMPVIVYQIIAFISPGLTRQEKNYVFRALPFVTLLFVGGLAFGYFVVLRAALGFLLGFGTDEIQTVPRLGDYIGFVTNLLLWIGVSFQTPVVVYVLIKAGIVSARRLTSIRRYVFIDPDRRGDHHADLGPDQPHDRGHPYVRPLRAGYPPRPIHLVRPGSPRSPRPPRRGPRI